MKLLFAVVALVLPLPLVAVPASNIIGKSITKWGSFCNISSNEGCNLSAPGAIDPGDGQFSVPYDLAYKLSPLGIIEQIYVTDLENGRVQVFTPRFFPLG